MAIYETSKNDQNRKNFQSNLTPASNYTFVTN